MKKGYSKSYLMALDKLMESVVREFSEINRNKDESSYATERAMKEFIIEAIEELEVTRAVPISYMLRLSCCEGFLDEIYHILLTDELFRSGLKVQVYAALCNYLEHLGDYQSFNIHEEDNTLLKEE